MNPTKLFFAMTLTLTLPIASVQQLSIVNREAAKKENEARHAAAVPK